MIQNRLTHPDAPIINRLSHDTPGVSLNIKNTTIFQMWSHINTLIWVRSSQYRLLSQRSVRLREEIDVSLSDDLCLMSMCPPVSLKEFSEWFLQMRHNWTLEPKRWTLNERNLSWGYTWKDFKDFYFQRKAHHRHYKRNSGICSATNVIPTLLPIVSVSLMSVFFPYMTYL